MSSKVSFHAKKWKKKYLQKVIHNIFSNIMQMIKEWIIFCLRCFNWCHSHVCYSFVACFDIKSISYQSPCLSWGPSCESWCNLDWNVNCNFTKKSKALQKYILHTMILNNLSYNHMERLKIWNIPVGLCKSRSHLCQMFWHHRISNWWNSC